MNRLFSQRLTVSLILGLSVGAGAQNPPPDSRQISIPMYAVTKEGIGDSIGRVVVTEFPDGLEFRPSLTGLIPGLHGFHVHENPDCGPGPAPEGDGMLPAKAAGGHWDPENTGAHKAPWENGHFGDLPALYANRKEVAEHPVFKMRMRLDDLPGHALIVHHGGDNYKDDPVPSGGGGPIVACGVIPED